MLLLASVLVYSSLSLVLASFPGSYDSKLQELPNRLQHLLPEGLPWPVLLAYSPLQAESESCLRDARFYLDGMKTFQPWALQMLDASSKLPAGIMRGHTHDLGNYDQCLSTSPPYFSTQMCVVDLHGFVPVPRLRHPDSETTLGGLPLLKHPKLSFCLPSSCSLSDVAAHFSHVASQWNVTAHVNQYSCSVRDTPPLDVLDWFAVVVVSCLILITVASTGYEMLHPANDDRVLHQLLVSFSVITNGRKLFSTVDSRQPLTYLGGLRFLSIVWVMLGHHMIMQFLVPAVNWIILYEDMPGTIFSPMQNAMLAVDTFLVLTGMLIARFFLIEIGTKQRRFKLLPFYLHRIIRVSPALLLVILLAATLAARVENGPLWHSFFTRHKEYCRNNGWTNIFYLNNYIDADHQCCSYTWYLCVDIHLYLLSPLILFPLLKSKHFAQFGLPLLILIAITIDFLVVFLNKLPAGSLLTRDLRTEDNYSLEYTTTHTRAAPWLVGIGLGYILHSLRDSKVKLSQMTVICCWVVVSASMICSVFFISYFHQDSQVINYDVLESALYISLHRVVWAVGIAWIMFACETGYAGPVRTFLSCRVFQPLGRLSFSLYMVHASVQYTMVAARKSPANISPLFIVRNILGEFLMSLVQAVLLTLTVEAPFIQLEKICIHIASKKNLNSNEKMKESNLKEQTIVTPVRNCIDNIPSTLEEKGRDNVDTSLDASTRL